MQDELFHFPHTFKVYVGPSFVSALLAFLKINWVGKGGHCYYMYRSCILVWNTINVIASSIAALLRLIAVR